MCTLAATLRLPVLPAAAAGHPVPGCDHHPVGPHCLQAHHRPAGGAVPGAEGGRGGRWARCCLGCRHPLCGQAVAKLLWAVLAACATMASTTAVLLPAPWWASAGFEARGLIFGAPLAVALGCAFVPLRKPGKLPGAWCGGGGRGRCQIRPQANGCCMIFRGKSAL